MTQKQFLKDLNNESNHRILLWHALRLTSGIHGGTFPDHFTDLIVEFGSGHGSTPFLKQYGEKHGRDFKSFENNLDWANKTGSTLISNWNLLPEQWCGVLFIDHAPGEQRKFDIAKHKDSALIMVIHDTEIAADHGYQMRDVIKNNFEWIVELNPIGGGAGSIMCSNHIEFDHTIIDQMDGFEITNFIEK